MADKQDADFDPWLYLAVLNVLEYIDSGANENNEPYVDATEKMIQMLTDRVNDEEPLPSNLSISADTNQAANSTFLDTTGAGTSVESFFDSLTPIGDELGEWPMSSERALIASFARMTRAKEEGRCPEFQMAVKDFKNKMRHYVGDERKTSAVAVPNDSLQVPERSKPNDALLLPDWNQQNDSLEFPDRSKANDALLLPDWNQQNDNLQFPDRSKANDTLVLPDWNKQNDTIYVDDSSPPVLHSTTLMDTAAHSYPDFLPTHVSERIPNKQRVTPTISAGYMQPRAPIPYEASELVNSQDFDYNFFSGLAPKVFSENAYTDRKPIFASKRQNFTNIINRRPQTQLSNMYQPRPIKNQPSMQALPSDHSNCPGCSRRNVPSGIYEEPSSLYTTYRVGNDLSPVTSETEYPRMANQLPVGQRKQSVRRRRKRRSLTIPCPLKR